MEKARVDQPVVFCQIQRGLNVLFALILRRFCVLDLAMYQWFMDQQREGRILPRYEDGCLSNIPEAVCYLFGQRAQSVLGAPMLAAGLVPNPKGKVVVLLLDGFGFTQLQRYVHEYEFLRRLADRGWVTPITSVFPSTTAAALSTMATGETPQQHGLPEWLLYEETLDELFYTIPFKSLHPLPDGASLEGRESPELMISGQTFIEQLVRDGVPSSFVLSHQDIGPTSYSRRAYRGATFVPYKDAASMVDRLREGLTNTRGPAYFYVYYERIDKICHRAGPHSKNYLAELGVLFDAIRTGLLTMDPRDVEDVSLIVTADHGHINIDPTKTVFLNDEPDVLSLLRRGRGGQMILPWGSNRDCFLAIAPNRLDEAHKYLTWRFRDDALVLRSEDAIAQGYFGRGELHPRFRSRVGDLLILPNDTKTIWYQHKPGDRQYTRLGSHGGLTPDEMLVPFVCARLSELVA